MMGISLLRKLLEEDARKAKQEEDNQIKERCDMELEYPIGDKVLWKGKYTATVIFHTSPPLSRVGIQWDHNESWLGLHDDTVGEFDPKSSNFEHITNTEYECRAEWKAKKIGGEESLPPIKEYVDRRTKERIQAEIEKFEKNYGGKSQ